MEENPRIMWQMDDERVVCFVEEQAKEPIYATVDDFEKALAAIKGLVISLDDLRTIIHLATDVSNAEDVCDELESIAGAGKGAIRRARDLEQSMKERFTEYMTRLGRRHYHELVCLHEFGLILNHRDDLGKHEIMYFLDALDRYDPSAWTDCVKAVEKYSFALFLPEVISLAFKEHPAWKAAEEGKYEGQEWKYKDHSAAR